MAPLNSARDAGTPQRPRQTRHSSLQFEQPESPPRTPRRSIRHLRPSSSSQRTLVAADEPAPEARHARRATTPLASLAETTRRLAPSTFPRRPSTAEPPRPRSLSRHRKHLAEDNKAYMPPRRVERSGAETDEGFEDGARGRRGWLRPRAAVGSTDGEAGTARKESARAESAGADDGAVTEEDEPPSRASGKRRATASMTPSRHSSPLNALDADKTLVDIEDEDSELEAELDHLRDVLEADDFAQPHEPMGILTQPSFALGAMLGRAFRHVFSLAAGITSSFIKATALAVVVLAVYMVLWLPVARVPSPPPLPSLPVDHVTPPIPAPETPDTASRILSMESAIASLSARLSASHDDLSAHLQSLDASVDELSKLPKDTLAIPDFALWSAGATIAPELTSPTFSKPPTRALGVLWTTDPGATGAPPETALRPDTHRGACWPLAGAAGQLGVALPAPLHVTAVSVDHVPREVAPDVRSAPREMEVWARVEGAENLARLAQDGAPRAVVWGEGEEAKTETVDAADKPEMRVGAETYVRLAEFAYDIHAPRSVQTFEVPPEMRALGLDTQRVALRIKSNWGREEFTCLYRFRVHGEQRGESPV